MGIDDYRRHFFEALHEEKDDDLGGGLYEDAERVAFHEDGLPYLESLPRDFESVLDAGCGCGYDARWLARQGKQVTGLTANPTPSQQRFAAESGFAIRHMDMHALDFADASIDAILCKHSLEHAFSPLGALFEMRRVLRPGGYLFLVVPPHHPGRIESGHFTQGWSIGQVAYCLAVTGFDARGAAYRERGWNVEAVARRADTLPEGRGLYEIAPRLPDALRALQRDDWHGGFPRDRFQELQWPFAGGERTTVAKPQAVPLPPLRAYARAWLAAKWRRLRAASG